MNKTAPKRKSSSTRELAAIMFTDIAGYTAMMQQDEAKAIAVRQRHREVFEKAHDMYRGKIIQYYGDGTLSIFKSAVETVECALDLQKKLSIGDLTVPLRIGIHIGDIVYSSTEIMGDGVNVASRIESMASVGAILISGNLNQELKNHRHIVTESLGTYEFKNVLKPMEVFAIANEGIAVPDPDKIEGKFKRPYKSIAVLPLVNMSSNQENEYFSDGLTEEIINALTKVEGLRVTSRTSSFHFKGRDLSARQIGKELNVSTILEGSVRLSGNRVRITAQLIDVDEDYHFWSEKFDRSLDDIFALEDEISLLIAERLREHLGHMEIKDQLVEAPDLEVDDYKEYLRSRYHILRMSKSEIEKGIAILKKVVKRNPEFAMGHLGLHQGYLIMGTIGFIPSEEGLKLGNPHLEKALEIDEDLPQCQLQLAWNSYIIEWDMEGAYDHLSKVEKSMPFVDYYSTMASILIAEGKFQAAHNFINTAIQLDPFSDVNLHLKGTTYYMEEKYEEALKFYEKSIAINPGSEVSLLEYGGVMIMNKQFEKALSFYENLPDDELIKPTVLAMIMAKLGNTKKAQEGIARLEKMLDSDKWERAIFLLILSYANLGDWDKTLALLEEAVDKRVPMMVYLDREPFLKPLRDNKKFQELMGRVFKNKVPEGKESKKYKKSLLTPNLLKRYRQELEELMISHKPYLDPNLTLNELAMQIRIPANQLSQLLNEGFDQNFSEFVNSYRVEEFKKRAADPANANLTLLSQAYDSGFNSKTVFNSFFKKKTGQTPKAYWNSVH